MQYFSSIIIAINIFEIISRNIGIGTPKKIRTRTLLKLL